MAEQAPVTARPNSPRSAENVSPDRRSGRGTTGRGSSDWTSAYDESTVPSDIGASALEGLNAEEHWLRRMLQGVQLPFETIDGDQETVMNDLEALEHGLKVIGFAKITDAVESATRAKVAFEQMMRIQVREKEQYRQMKIILDQYKDLVHKLSAENRLLREQIPTPRGSYTSVATGPVGGQDGFDGTVAEAKEQAAREPDHENVVSTTVGKD